MHRRAWLVAIIALSACSRTAHATATPPPLLIDERGVTMPFAAAVKHIAFRPLIPSLQVLAYAVLPPLGGSDTDAHRGLGIEFVANRQAWLLSQWPKGSFSVGFGRGAAPALPCALQHFSPTGVAWVTPQNVVTTLQADGNAPPHAIEIEARRLRRADACRESSR